MAPASTVRDRGQVSQRLRLFLSSPNPDDLAKLTELLESGTISPVINQSYPLAQAPEALRHVATGHARGKVVVTLRRPAPDHQRTAEPGSGPR